MADVVSARGFKKEGDSEIREEPGPVPESPRACRGSDRRLDGEQQSCVS